MLRATLLFLLLFAGFGALGRGAAEVWLPDPPPPVSDDAVPRPGRQYLLVYVGSSRCGPSNSPALAEDVKSLMATLGGRARSEGVGFVRVGVARELSSSRGLEHLARIGEFDEVAAGQGVMNQASAHFVSVDHRGTAATPQLIVVERELSPQGQGVDEVGFSERVLLRKVGTAEISAWRKLGAPLPKRRTQDDLFILAQDSLHEPR